MSVAERGVLGSLDGSRLGLDPSPKAIALARERHPDCDFRVAEARDQLKREKGSADLVLLMDVLEHVEDDAGLLADAVGLLKPGGHLIATVPAGPGLWTRHDVEYGHHRRYTLQQFARLLSGPGVRIRMISYFQSRLYPFVWIARKLARGIEVFPPNQGKDPWLPPSLVNRFLERVFAGEGDRIEALLRGDDVLEFMRGSSLIAVCAKSSNERPA